MTALIVLNLLPRLTFDVVIGDDADRAWHVEDEFALEMAVAFADKCGLVQAASTLGEAPDWLGRGTMLLTLCAQIANRMMTTRVTPERARSDICDEAPDIPVSALTASWRHLDLHNPSLRGVPARAGTHRLVEREVGPLINLFGRLLPPCVNGTQQSECG